MPGLKMNTTKTTFKGKGVVQITGRQTGKSYWTSQAIDRLMRDIMQQPISDLVLSEGTVYGSRYYTVEPVGGNWKDMELWCGESFGDPGDKIWDSGPAPLPAKRWYMNNRKFWFRNEKDRDWFIIRWRS
jgi:hypothetical protein